VQQHKNEYQQNNVNHSDGLPEKQIAHLVAQIRTKFCKKIVRDRQKHRLRDRQTCSDKSYQKNCKSNLYNKGQP